MEGQQGFCFGRGQEGLEIFQTVPFCFQSRLYLCKCALCPLAYCLNSIVGSSQGPRGPMRPDGALPGGLGHRTIGLGRYN